MKAPPRNAPHRRDSTAGKEPDSYAELLSLAHDEGLKSIQTQVLAQPTEENGHRCIVKAIVETEKGRFESIGDADPGNVEDSLAPHLIRVAETRAKVRALRDAVNCGVVSFEELDGVSLEPPSSLGSGATTSRSPRETQNGSHAASPRGKGQGGSARPTNGAVEPMTQAQRRYLFRILAEQGYQGEDAKERLKDLCEVSSLSHVTKAAASSMIEQLLEPAPAGNGRRGNGAVAHQR